MDLIERYIYQVVKNLPKHKRQITSTELKIMIHEMLSENPTDIEIEKVLNSLGNPKKLRQKYASGHTLISADLFDDYIRTLKPACIILVAAYVGVEIIESFGVNSGSIELSTIIPNLIFTAISALAKGFLWVTLVFAAFEFFKLKFDNDAFDAKKLPKIDGSNKKSTSRSALSAILFNIIFFVAFYFFCNKYYDALAVYIVGQERIPIFNQTALLNFLPLFALAACFTIFVNVIIFTVKRYTLAINFLSFFELLFSTTIWVRFIVGEQTFNPLFTSFIKIDINPIINLVVGVIILSTAIQIIFIFLRKQKQPL